MKLKFLPLLFSFLLCSSLAFAQTQPCWECGIPGIALYDFDVQVPKPSTPEAQTTWRKLFLPAGHFNHNLSTTYASSNCLTIFHAYDWERDSPDPDHVNLPGTRGQSHADYLVTGEVTGSGDNYTLTVKVIGADNRKLAFSTTTTFNLSDPDGPRDAGVRAANQLAPLLEKIKAFEQAEREASTDVALQSNIIGEVKEVEIKITPAKYQLSLNEEIEVEIEMLDCDGYKLKNRKVRFTSGEVAGLPIGGTTCGNISPAEVITDDQGKAKVKYKAGGQPCSGKIVAYYGFTHPNGAPGVLYGTVPINVMNTDTWFVDIYYHYKMKNDLDKTSQAAEYTKYEKGSSNFETEYRGMFLYKPKTPMTDEVSISSLADPEEEGLVYNFFQESNHHSIGNSYMKAVYTDGTVLTDRIRNQATGKPTNTRAAAINFSYGSTGNSLSLSLDFEVDRTSVRSGFLGNGTTTSKDVESVGQLVVLDGFGSAEFELLPPTPKFPFKMYKVTFEDNGSTVSSGSRTTWTETVRAYIMSPSTITGVVDDFQEQGKGLVLEQNYPNPFHGSTVIPYTLPAKAQVSLGVYDMAGRPVKQLVNETKPAGHYRAEVQNLDLKPGMYFYKLQVGSQVITKRMIHL